jgi:hypothetical protein
MKLNCNEGCSRRINHQKACERKREAGVDDAAIFGFHGGWEFWILGVWTDRTFGAEWSRVTHGSKVVIELLRQFNGLLRQFSLP